MDDHIIIMRMRFALHIKRKTVIHAPKVEIKRTFCIVVFSSCSYHYVYITDYNSYLKTIVGCYMVLVKVPRAQIHITNMCDPEWRIGRTL